MSKNARRHRQQNYICKQCGRRFVESYNSKDHSDNVKRICLRMYVNIIRFRAIERVMCINHNTIINLVRLVGMSLTDAPQAADEMKRWRCCFLPILLPYNRAKLRANSSYEESSKQLRRAASFVLTSIT